MHTRAHTGEHTHTTLTAPMSTVIPRAVLGIVVHFSAQKASLATVVPGTSATNDMPVLGGRGWSGASPSPLADRCNCTCGTETLLAGSTGKASAPVPRPASVPPPRPPTAAALAADGTCPKTTSVTIVALMAYEQLAGTALEKNICVACTYIIFFYKKKTTRQLQGGRRQY